MEINDVSSASEKSVRGGAGSCEDRASGIVGRGEVRDMTSRIGDGLAAAVDAADDRPAGTGSWHATYDPAA
jgi:hypothetical protein